MTDETYVETRDTPVCDFCCARAADWTYRSSAEPLLQEALLPDGRVIRVEEHGTDWSACWWCSRGIEQGSRDQSHAIRLARSVVARMPGAKGLKKDKVGRALIKQHLVMTYTYLLPALSERVPFDPTTFDGVLTAQGDPDLLQLVMEDRKTMQSAVEETAHERPPVSPAEGAPSEADLPNRDVGGGAGGPATDGADGD